MSIICLFFAFAFASIHLNALVLAVCLAFELEVKILISIIGVKGGIERGLSKQIKRKVID